MFVNAFGFVFVCVSVVVDGVVVLSFTCSITRSFAFHISFTCSFECSCSFTCCSRVRVCLPDCLRVRFGFRFACVPMRLLVVCESVLVYVEWLYACRLVDTRARLNCSTYCTA